MVARAVAFALVVLVASSPSGSGLASGQTRSRPDGLRCAGVRGVAVEDASAYWTRGGFVEMTPPLRIPSNATEQISVWLRIPDGARISVIWRSGGYSLAYPAGTIADRVDLADARDAHSVTDVRGTRFEADAEYFHVLRPLGDPSVDLTGAEWRRGDEGARQEATDWLLGQMSFSADADAEGASVTRELGRFAALNDCGSCHAHDKPTRRTRAEGGLASDDRLPNRGTDAAGLFVVQSVLSDEAPLETHRARDRNAADPFVSVDCVDGGAARLSGGPRGALRYVCDDGSVPLGRLMLKSALAHGDAHARAVCRSRSYLSSHMDALGQAAFASALTECAGSEGP